jgi:hypothetical protein
MLEKLTRSLTEAIAPLLPADIEFGDKEAIAAFETTRIEIIQNLRGDPWRLATKVIEELRQKTHPNLLSI